MKKEIVIICIMLTFVYATFAQINHVTSLWLHVSNVDGDKYTNTNMSSECSDTGKVYKVNSPSQKVFSKTPKELAFLNQAKVSLADTNIDFKIDIDVGCNSIWTARSLLSRVNKQQPIDSVGIDSSFRRSFLDVKQTFEDQLKLKPTDLSMNKMIIMDNVEEISLELQNSFRNMVYNHSKK